MNELATQAREMLTGCVTLEQIVRLEDAMFAELGKTRGEPDDVCPVKHYFARGMYAREMTIPAGVVVVGKMHRHDHLCTVTRGRLMVAREGVVEEVAAPCTFVSPAGVKRVGVAMEETTWITYHLAESEDLEKIEADVIVPDSEVRAMIEGKTPCLGQQ